jgi:acyl-CoA synthetase (AMP-forming)/AMP-acid ligase II
MDLLIGDVFRNAARAVPDRMAAALGDESLTFRQIDQESNKVARALGRLGITTGDRVAVWSGTNLNVVLVFAALAKLGAVFAPLNALLGPAEIEGTARLARPALLLADGEQPPPAPNWRRSSRSPLPTLRDRRGWRRGGR